MSKKKTYFLIAALIFGLYGHGQTARDYAEKGRAKARQMDFLFAMADYTKAISLDSNFADAYYYRGLAEVGMQQYGHAVKDFDTAIMIEPAQADYYNARGNAWTYLKFYPEARRDYARALRLDSMATTYYFDKRAPTMAATDTGARKPVAKDSSRAEANDAEKSYKQAKEKIQTKDYKGALADLNLVILLDPKYAQAYADRAHVKTSMEDYKGALDDYDLALMLDTTDAAAFYARGMVKINLMKKDEACQDLNKSLQLGYAKAGEAVKTYCH